jgi:hypothetical protein
MEGMRNRLPKKANGKALHILMMPRKPCTRKGFRHKTMKNVTFACKIGVSFLFFSLGSIRDSSKKYKN